jgi:D-glycero-beta-D-manno-heptose-7-phosphate kinase
MKASTEIEKMLAAIEKFPAVHILVLGDIIVDRYLFGEVSRISPEAPVPVVSVDKTELRLGGAANVFNNIYSLGGRATLSGVIGDDNYGAFIANRLTKLGTSIEGLIKVPNRRTTVKTRIIAHNQQVVRFDFEEVKEVQKEALVEFFQFFDAALPEFDAVVISDYIKGVVTTGLMERIQKYRCENGGRPLIIDPKPRQQEIYKKATVITPNQKEAEAMTGLQVTNKVTLNLICYKLLYDLNVNCVLMTRGQEGMALLEEGKQLVELPTVAKKVYDVTGAGDTVVSLVSLGIAAGLDFYHSAKLANIAAGIVVEKVGTVPVSKEDLVSRVTAGSRI